MPPRFRVFCSISIGHPKPGALGKPRSSRFSQKEVFYYNTFDNKQQAWRCQLSSVEKWVWKRKEASVLLSLTSLFDRNYKGSRKILLSDFFPLRGGGPPNFAKKNPAWNRYFLVNKPLFLALYGPFFCLFVPFLILFNTKTPFLALLEGVFPAKD